MNYEENNKFIAEFMGYVNTTPTAPNFNIYENEDGHLLEVMSMQYHKSWDWLMPVIAKIRKLNWRDDGRIGVVFVEIFNALDDVDIEDTYNAVVDFIKWYENESIQKQDARPEQTGRGV